jgi:para-nitrobenzyl esterase
MTGIGMTRAWQKISRRKRRMSCAEEKQVRIKFATLAGLDFYFSSKTTLDRHLGSKYIFHMSFLLCPTHQRLLLKLQRRKLVIWSVLLLGIQVLHAQELRHVQVRTTNGDLEGVVSADGKVRTFKGIPYAAPPVGPLRWKPPQPVRSWVGVRSAVDYPPRAIQGRIYSDMVFHDAGPSEDCLYLNIWMPENHPETKLLPVMVWIHGGGFIAGSTSEPRQDAGNLSKKGVMVVSLGYRLGVFGFLALPELTQESEHNASGNYGLLDQVAALKWIQDNIAMFGGDPDNVTIFGQSAGSSSVSALMASPLAKGLFQRAIGESGTMVNPMRPLKPRAEAEAAGMKFAEDAFGTASLETLRGKSAQEILAAALKLPQAYFSPDVDGYFLPTNCLSIYAAGGQSHVPLLAGWNKDEGDSKSYFTNDAPTFENYATRAKARFGSEADAFLKVYSATNDAQARRAARDFSGDLRVGYPTWKWLEMQLAANDSLVFRYEFEQTLPLPADAKPDAEPTSPHSAEIEYVFRVLSSKQLPWRPDDHELSELMASYWSNFAKNGDPNGQGLPPWPVYKSQENYPVMHFKANSDSTPDEHRDRYEFLDHLNFSQ